MVGRFDGIGSVADVSADSDRVVSSDGAWKGCLWVGLTEHHAAHFDSVHTLPDHRADWTRVHVFYKSGEESLNT